jgi:hypothetical protein
MLRPEKNDEQYEEALEKVYAVMQKDVKDSSKGTILKNNLAILHLLLFGILRNKFLNYVSFIVFLVFCAI